MGLLDVSGTGPIGASLSGGGGFGNDPSIFGGGINQQTGGVDLEALGPLLAALGSTATQQSDLTSILGADNSSNFARANRDVLGRLQAQALLSSIFPGQADFSGLAGMLNQFGRGPEGNVLSFEDLITKRDAASAIPEIKNLGGGGGGGGAGGILGLIGAGVGGFYGGPAGASAGLGIGSTLGGMFG